MPASPPPLRMLQTRARRHALPRAVRPVAPPAPTLLDRLADWARTLTSR